MPTLPSPGRQIVSDILDRLGPELAEGARDRIMQMFDVDNPPDRRTRGHNAPDAAEALLDFLDSPSGSHMFKGGKFPKGEGTRALAALSALPLQKGSDKCLSDWKHVDLLTPVRDGD